MSEPRRFTRIAAYAICTDVAGRLLVCRLSGQVAGYEGWWTLPGGGLDHGEDPRDGALREVEEETGLEVELERLIDANSFRAISETRDFWGVRILYRARVVGGELRNEPDGSTDLCAWLSRDELAAVQRVDILDKALEWLDAEADSGA